MGLFIRSTKTRVWGQLGKVSFTKFTTPVSEGGEPALCIDLAGEDKKKYSITIYGDEIKSLITFLNQQTLNS